MTGIRDHIITFGVLEIVEGGFPPIPVRSAAVERDGDGPALWVQTTSPDADEWSQHDASGWRRLETASTPYVDSRKSLIFARMHQGPDGVVHEEAMEIEVRRARPADASWLSRFGLRPRFSGDIVGQLAKWRATGVSANERLEAVSIPGRSPHALVYRAGPGADSQAWVLNAGRWHRGRMPRSWVTSPRIVAAHRVGRSLPWLTGVDGPTDEPDYLISDRMMLTEVLDWGIERAMARICGPERPYDTAYFLALACEPDDEISPGMMGPANAAALERVSIDAAIPDDGPPEPWESDFWVNDPVDDAFEAPGRRQSENPDLLPPFVLHDEDEELEDSEGIAAYEALLANVAGLSNPDRTLTALELVDALDFYEDQILDEDVDD